MFLFLTRDNGRHLVPYLKEVGLAGNLPNQLQSMYVSYYARIDATCRVGLKRMFSYSANIRTYLGIFEYNFRYSNNRFQVIEMTQEMALQYLIIYTYIYHFDIYLPLYLMNW